MNRTKISTKQTFLRYEQGNHEVSQQVMFSVFLPRTVHIFRSNFPTTASASFYVLQ